MEHERRALRALAAAVVLVAFVACSADRGAPPGGDSGSRSATSPEISQARWKISTHPSGNLRKLGKRNLRRVRRQGRALRRLVVGVYGAFFLDPAGRAEVLRRRFHPRAARALPARVGVPRRATDVRTTVRKADIGIDTHGRRRAAAAVKVRAKGQAGDRPFRVVHRATLWLERYKGRWKVIAFDIRQRPVR